MRYSHPELVDRLAAEYVLGTLQGGARRRFIRLLADRADVRLAVMAWETRLTPLANSIRPVKPPAHVWTAISTLTQPGKAAFGAASGASSPGWSWLRPASWGLGGIAAGVAISAAALLTAPTLFMTADQIAMRSGEKLPQSYVGVLTDPQGNGRLLVSSLRHGKTVTLKVIGKGDLSLDAAPLELWALPPADVNGGKPFLLAKVPVKGSGTAMLPDTSEKLLSKISKLAVTQTNTTQPGTPGELVLSGNCAKLW
jgi:anti-sigma-K factor RskA